jgi:hypothetical protein
MGTPIAYNGEYQGRYVSTTFNRGTVAQNLVPSLSPSFSWWNGVDISTQYLIYSDTYSQGQAPYGTSRPTAWTTPDLTDASLLALINTLPDRVGYPVFTDLDIALNWMQGTNKYFLLKSGYENITTSGLQVNFDAAWYTSYSGTSNIYNINTSANAGSLVNGTNFQTYNGGALNFDGTDDIVTFNAPNLTTTATVEMWCRPTSFTDKMFIGFGGYDVYAGFGGAIGYNTANSDSYGISSAMVSNLNLLNNWNHYVFEFRSDVSYTNNKIYINGVSMPLSQISSSENPSARNFNSGNGVIASWFYGGYYMPMQLGVFRVYNRSLTGDEITNNYNAQKARFGHTNTVTSGMTLNLDASNPISYPGTGTNWYDLSSYSNNGVLTNGPTFSTNNFGYVSFDGADDLVNCGNGSSLAIVGDMTVCTWIYFNNFSGYNGIVGKTSSNAVPAPYDYYTNPGGTISFLRGNGSAYTTVQSSGSASSGAWQFVAVTMCGTTVTHYLNNTTNGSGTLSTSIADNGDPLFIGNRGDNFTDLNGRVGNVQIYNRALLATEIQQNYFDSAWKYGKGIDRYGLVMYNDPGNFESYPGNNILWKDISGSGNNMVLYNGPTFNSSYGGVIQMDATDDYARVTSPNIILGTNPRTAILWFYATTSQYGCIYGFGNSPNGTPAYGSMELWNYANPLSLHYAGGSISSGLNLSINTNKWLMCALRFDGTNASIRIIDNGTVYSNFAAVPLNTYSANYSINKSAYANEGGGMGGYIGISATYIRSLSDGEVTNFYNETKSRYGL